MYEKDLEEIGKRIAELRKARGWTQEMLAEKLNIARNTLTKLEGGFRDFKSTEILKIAETLGVSIDYLFGRTRVTAPDDFIQEAVDRLGLSEQALQTLERLNAPLDIESTERERLMEEGWLLAAALEAGMEELNNNADTPPVIKTKNHYTQEDIQAFAAIAKDESNKQELSILNDMLTVSLENGYTYGLQILSTIYDYCRYEFRTIRQMDATASSAHHTRMLTPDMQRQCKLLELNNIVAQLRDKLTGR
jgi:transcriptional regulator with XRE-family HTH domain